MSFEYEVLWKAADHHRHSKGFMRRLVLVSWTCFFLSDPGQKERLSVINHEC